MTPSINRSIPTITWIGIVALLMTGSEAIMDPARGADPERRAPTTAPDDSGTRPNVVLILADDLGFGDLACYGHPTFRTPNLDRLADEGVRLTQTWVPVPFCAPSRATILTGRYPWRNGMVRNPAPDAPNGRGDFGMDPEEITLAEILGQAGYATACIGKWHLGHQPGFFPTEQGFDEYLGILYSNDMRPVELVETVGSAKRVIEYPVVQATLTERYTERAVRFIEDHDDGPFFLYLPHAMPHKPLAASEAYYKRTGTGLYGDVIAELDASVGRILETLRERGLERNTLVFFLSDNGPWYGGSTGGLRGMKGRTWEGGLRIPLIARWPGVYAEGLVSDAVVGTIDLVPTILAACRVAPPEGVVLDGLDITSIFTEPGTESPHEVIVGMQGGRLAVVRSGRWKLHVREPGNESTHPVDKPWVDPRGPDGVTILAPFEQPQPNAFPGLLGGVASKRMMLFDMESDPGEQRNVAREHPEVVQRLKAQFDTITRQAQEVAKGRD